MTECPACGRENPSGDRACSDCGTPLDAGNAANQVRRFATVVNSDLKGSTALGEKLDPESLREVLTLYFDEMRAVFEAHGGTIEKIIGDAIVAVFGFPEPREDDALRAVEAAAESVTALHALNDRLEATWGVRLIARTGVSTGDVVVGEATEGQHVLTGDTMRISTAMEQNAPALEVLIAEPTYELVRAHVNVEPAATVTPKGMAVAVPTYRLLGVTSGAAYEGEAADPAVGARRPAARESRKTVTLVFADPRPTSLSGEPLSAEVLRDVMSMYFDAMRAALSHHGGTVEKFIGDAVMAVFGLPIRHEDDAVRAVRAAADMQAALPALNEAFRERWGIQLGNHIGVNTGEVITGDARTGQRLVTGDAVNTAARLEQAAGPAEIILGDLTYRLARHEIEVEAIEPLNLKGKAEPVPAYRLTSVRDRGSVAATGGEDAGAPFVGREAEMGRLLETLEDAHRAQRARLLTVVGDPGVGKSRLIKEFAAGVDGASQVVRGRCLPYGDGITFWPLAEIVRASASIASDDTLDVAIAKIRALMRGAGLSHADRSAVADRVAAAMGLTQTQFPVAELFWGARRLIEALAHDRPLVMIVDDIHAAETTFLELLDHLLELVDAAPVLILCSSRHVLMDKHPEWSTAHAEQLIVLRPLSDDDTGRMIDELLGRAGLDPTIVGRIVGAAEGIPLFVEQMVSMLVDNGTLRRDGDRWIVSGSAGRIVVPPTIHALLAARLDDLAEGERAVVEPASIVGLVFAEAAVEHLIEPSLRDEMPGDLASLVRKQFVRPDKLDDEDAYRFGHQLIRDTAYGSMLKRERASLHERFVEWADEINRQRGRETEFEEILGYHLEQAHRYRRDLGPLDEHGIELGVRASERLAPAGRRALARGDFPAAANLLDRAAHLLDERRPERPRLLISAGEAYMEIGEFATAEATLAEASALAKAIDDVPVSTTAELVRLQLHLRSEASTSIEDVMHETIRAINDLEGTRDPNALARAWRLLELAHGMSGRFESAAEANIQASRYARRSGDGVLEMRLNASAAMAAPYGPMPVPDGIARCEELLLIAEHDRRSQGLTLAALAHLRAMNGDFVQARDDYRRAREILQELGLGFDASTISIDSGPVELLAGDLEAAEYELRRDYAALDAIGERNYISTIAGLLGEVLYRQSRFEEAGGYAAFCEQVAAASDVHSQFLWRGVRAKLLARDGMAQQGIELAMAGVELARSSDDIEGQGDALIFLAETQASAGLDQDAVESAEEARQLFGAKGNVVSETRAIAFIDALGVPRSHAGAPSAQFAV